MKGKEKTKNSEGNRKIDSIFPRTRRILEDKLQTTMSKLTDMYQQGVPWQHDAGGFHFDLRNLEAERSRLEAMLRNSEVVMPPKYPSVVALGVKVALEIDGEGEIYMFGSQLDALSLNNRASGGQWLSTESPLGSYLLGKEVGATSTFKTPDGNKLNIKVVSISSIPEEEIT